MEFWKKKIVNLFLEKKRIKFPNKKNKNASTKQNKVFKLHRMTFKFIYKDVLCYLTLGKLKKKLIYV